MFFNPAQSLTFGDQPVNTVSVNQFISIGNNSNTAVTLNSINVTGDFILSQNACPTPIPAFTGCALQFAFQPTATGVRVGSVSINSSDSTSAHMLSLQGRGIGAGVASLQPASLIFGQQHIGTNSSSQPVSLMNTGTGPLNIVGISTSAHFSETDTCNTAIQPGESCQINVSFVPGIPGILNGFLFIQDDAAGGPHAVSLQGTAFDKQLTTVSVISSSPVSIVGGGLTFTAAVGSTSGTPTGSVDFYSGPTKIGSAALTGGAAQFVDSSLAAGAYSITAAYLGDANNFNNTSPALLQVVDRAHSSIQLSSSANPSTVSNSITFTANILPSTGPGASGSVQFYDGNTLLATTMTTNGTATFNTSGLGPGVHEIQAIYSGDLSYSDGHSNFLQIVNQAGVAATQLMFTLAVMPPNAGAVPGTLLSRQKLNFSTQVSSTTAGSFTGNILVIDGDTPIQSIPVDGSGHATFVLPSVTTGSHTLTVVYSGDGNFSGATSNTVSIQRSPKPH